MAEVDVFEKREFIWRDQYGDKFFVSDGLSQGRQWGIYRRRKKGERTVAGGVYVGNLQRICSPALPMVDTKTEAQKKLNRWAMGKRYRLVCVLGGQIPCPLNSELCCRYCSEGGCCRSACKQSLPCTYDGSKEALLSEP